MKLFIFLFGKKSIMKKIIIYFLILCFLCGCSNSTQVTREISSISVDSVFSMMNVDDVYIIDVREDYEYHSGHIENSYNIPLSQINEIQNSFIPINGIIIVYCKSGTRSRKAAELLLQLGYQNVYDMGSVNLWNYGLITE